MEELSPQSRGGLCLSLGGLRQQEKTTKLYGSEVKNGLEDILLGAGNPDSTWVRSNSLGRPYSMVANRGYTHLGAGNSRFIWLCIQEAIDP